MRLSLGFYAATDLSQPNGFYVLVPRPFMFLTKCVSFDLEDLWRLEVVVHIVPYRSFGVIFFLQIWHH